MLVIFKAIWRCSGIIWAQEENLIEFNHNWDTWHRDATILQDFLKDPVRFDCNSAIERGNAAMFGHCLASLKRKGDSIEPISRNATNHRRF